MAAIISELSDAPVRQITPSTATIGCDPRILIQECLHVVKTCREQGCNTETVRQAVRTWLNKSGLGGGAGKSTRAQFITFCVEVLPRLRDRGVAITDHMASMLIDDSCRLDIRNIIYEANAAIVYANKSTTEGPCSELMEAITTAVSDPLATAEGLKRTASRLLDRPARLRFRATVQRYPAGADGNEEPGIRVTMYLPDEASLKRVRSRTKHWLDLPLSDRTAEVSD